MTRNFYNRYPYQNNRYEGHNNHDGRIRRGGGGGDRAQFNNHNQGQGVQAANANANQQKYGNPVSRFTLPQNQQNSQTNFYYTPSASGSDGSSPPRGGQNTPRRALLQQQQQQHGYQQQQQMYPITPQTSNQSFQSYGLGQQQQYNPMIYYHHQPQLQHQQQGQHQQPEVTYIYQQQQQGQVGQQQHGQVGQQQHGQVGQQQHGQAAQQPQQQQQVYQYYQQPQVTAAAPAIMPVCCPMCYGFGYVSAPSASSNMITSFGQGQGDMSSVLAPLQPVMIPKLNASMTRFEMQPIDSQSQQAPSQIAVQTIYQASSNPSPKQLNPDAPDFYPSDLDNYLSNPQMNRISNEIGNEVELVNGEL